MLMLIIILIFIIWDKIDISAILEKNSVLEFLWTIFPAVIIFFILSIMVTSQTSSLLLTNLESPAQGFDGFIKEFSRLWGKNVLNRIDHNPMVGGPTAPVGLDDPTAQFWEVYERPVYVTKTLSGSQIIVYSGGIPTYIRNWINPENPGVLFWRNPIVDGNWLSNLIPPGQEIPIRYTAPIISGHYYIPSQGRFGFNEAFEKRVFFFNTRMEGWDPCREAILARFGENIDGWIVIPYGETPMFGIENLIAGILRIPSVQINLQLDLWIFQVNQAASEWNN